ncbi:hypothetical protein ABZ468_46940 [Streptomyces sp. NPDC005708]|uniref:hypothetical protein n=1 Tax=Streptomyces sp. NPDC005708 TaxID=3154564 RepID=UPI0033D29DD3
MIAMPQEFAQSTIERKGEAGETRLAELPGIVEELQGRWGCVPRFATLLERIQPSTLAEVEDGDEVVRVAGRLNHRLAISAPPDLPRPREQADAWEEQLWRDARSCHMRCRARCWIRPWRLSGC